METTEKKYSYTDTYTDTYLNTQHPKSDLKTKAIQGGGITILAQFMISCITMIGTIILARLLTPNDFGLIAMVTSITGFFLIFKDLGLTDATIQKAEINHNQISTLFWINVAFSIVIMLLLITISPLIAYFYGEPRLKPIVITLSLTFLFAGLTTQHLALLKRKMLFLEIAAIEIISLVVSLFITISLAWYGLGYWALVIKPLILALSICVGAWFICPWRPGLPVYRRDVLPMITFGANILGFYSINYFARYLDKILIGWHNGSESLGYYHKAYYLCITPISQLVIPLYSVAVPVLSRLQNEPEKYHRYYINAISALAFVGMPMAGFMSTTSKNLVLLILGPQWIKATEIFSVLAIVVGIQMIYATNGWLHISLGRTDRWLRWGIVGSTATVISFLIGLPYGPLGVAIAYTTTIYILTGPGLLYAGKPINLKFSAIVSAIWRYFIAAITTGILYWYILPTFDIISNLLIKVLISFLIFVILYLVLIVAFFQNTKPILKFCSLIIEIFPKKINIMNNASKFDH